MNITQKRVLFVLLLILAVQVLCIAGTLSGVVFTLFEDGSFRLTGCIPFTLCY